MTILTFFAGIVTGLVLTIVSLVYLVGRAVDKSDYKNTSLYD